MNDQKKAYMVYHQNCGLKIGDDVKVLFKPASFSGGWCHDFGSYKQKWVGMVGKITDDKGCCGFNVTFGGAASPGGGFFPAFCLGKEDSPAPPTKEMTLPEIIKELGYEVKIVK